MVDLLKYLSRWPVTGKRGRKGTVSTEFRPGLDERIREGVDNLTRNIFSRRADGLVRNQDFDNLVMLSNHQTETGKSDGGKCNGGGTMRHGSVRMVQEKNRKRRKIGSIDIDASGDDKGRRTFKQAEAKCTYSDRTFKSFHANYNREMMGESAGAERKPEGENDADITGSQNEVACVEWTSDEHNSDDGRISGCDDIIELELDKSPKYASDRENGAIRAPDATTAGKGRKKREIKLRLSEDKSRKRRRKIESIDTDDGGVDNGSRFVKQTKAKCIYCHRKFKCLQALGGHKRVHHHKKPNKNRKMMEESAGADTKPEGANDADIAGSKIEFAASMKRSSDKHKRKEERITSDYHSFWREGKLKRETYLSRHSPVYSSGSDDINRSPKAVSVREDGEKRAPDATTAGKGRKKRERSKFARRISKVRIEIRH